MAGAEFWRLWGAEQLVNEEFRRGCVWNSTVHRVRGLRSAQNFAPHGFQAGCKMELIFVWSWWAVQYFENLTTKGNFFLPSFSFSKKENFDRKIFVLWSFFAKNFFWPKFFCPFAPLLKKNFFYPKILAFWPPLSQNFCPLVPLCKICKKKFFYLKIFVSFAPRPSCPLFAKKKIFTQKCLPIVRFKKKLDHWASIPLQVFPHSLVHVLELAKIPKPSPKTH